MSSAGPQPTSQPAVPQPATTSTDPDLPESIREALERHCGFLTAEEKKSFESLASQCKGLDDYVSKLEAACRKHKDGSVVLRVLDWFEPIFKVVNLYMPVTSTVIQAYPNPGSLVLGGIMAVVQTTDRIVSYQKLTLQMLSKMSVKAQVFFEYDKAKDLYRKDAEVQEALVKVYGDIIRFCSKAVRHITDEDGQLKAKVKRLVLSLVTDFESRLGEEVEQFQLHVDELQERALVCDKRRLKSLVDNQETQQQKFGLTLEKHFRKQGDDLRELIEKKEQRAQEQSLREQAERHRKLLLEWLSPLGFASVYGERCKNHLDGTGSWFLNSDAYEKWKYGSHSDILWVKGKPGCGKSILSAVAITDLKSEVGPNTPLAYAFCQREEAAKQNASTILGVLARQIAWNQSEVCGALDSEYRSPQKGDSPSPTVIRTAIKHALSHTARSYLVIDALDELKDSDELVMDLLNIMNDNDQTTKIIVFSRPDFNLEEGLAHVNELRPDHGENKADLEAYIESLFPDDDTSTGINQKIRQECINRADGMFLWVQLVHKSLQKPMSPKRRLLAIQETPPNLRHVYDGILNTIWSTDHHSRSIAFMVLLWVTNAVRPISCSSMLEAVAEFEGVRNLHELRQYMLSDPHELVSICANLIVIDNDGYIKLCHASVGDYLDSSDHTPIEPLSEYRQQKSRVHSRLAKICLDYLLLEDFQCGSARSPKRLLLSLRRHQFLAYAATYWATHVSQANDPHLQSLVLRLIASPQRRELSMQITLYNPSDVETWWYDPGRTNELHFLSLFGLKNVAETIPGVSMLAQEADGEELLPISYALINGHHEMILWLLETMFAHSAAPRDGQWKTHAALLAAELGWVEILEMLISNDPSCVNSMAPSGATPLMMSCAFGHEEVATLLIANGADIDKINNAGQNALIASILEKRAGLVNLLLDHGADPNSRDSDQTSALHHAAWSTSETVVQALLDHGANPLVVAPKWRDQLPLHIASMAEAVKAIEALVKSMSDLNIKSTSGSTALHAAAAYNSYRSAKCLLEHGISKDEFNKSKETALHVASRLGKCETVEVLVNAGCRVDLPDDDGRTAIHGAVYSGKVAVLVLVLESQPKPIWSTLLNRPDNHGETALHLAIRGGNVGIVRYLLRRGAEPLNGKFGASPLHVAAKNGHKSIARILLNHTKEANQRNLGGDSPLHVAARANKLEFIRQFFLDCEDLHISIDLDARNNYGTTALLLALQEGNEEVGKLLLDKGSSFISNSDGDYPIHPAAWHGYTTLVEEFLRHEGSSSRGYYGRTPLICAALRGHYSVVRLLVENTPETLNVQDDDQHSPVLLAMMCKHLDIVGYLLDSNADPFVSSMYGDTLLHLAAEIGDLPIVQRLLGLGCGVGTPNRYGQTPFSRAVGVGSLEIVGALMAAGFQDINALDNSGNSCIHVAAGNGDIEMLRKLQECGSRFETPNSFGETPFQVAAASGHYEIMALLNTEGGNSSSRNLFGDTALLSATRQGYPRVVFSLLTDEPERANEFNPWLGESIILVAAVTARPITMALLLAAGADPHPRNNIGLNALDYASLHPPLLQQMEKSGHFHDNEGPVRYLHLAYDMIRSCCEDILQLPGNSSSEDLSFRLTKCLLLTTALWRVHDFESAKLCMMELVWPEKFCSVQYPTICKICQEVNPQGDLHICKDCYVITHICDMCHQDYLEAESKAPGVLREIRKLELEVLEVRKASDGLSLRDAVIAVFTFPPGAQWVSNKLQEYKEWDHKYMTDGRYQEYPRPNLEFLKIISTAHDLLRKRLYHDIDTLDSLDREVTFKLVRQYKTLQRKHRTDAEIQQFICQGHEFLTITDAERLEVKSAGEVLDSTTGRLTAAFLQNMIAKVNGKTSPPTKDTTALSSESSFETPTSSDITPHQSQDIDRETLDSSQSLSRSHTIQKTLSEEGNEPLPERNSQIGTDSQLPTLTASEVPSDHNFTAKRHTRRAPTFPVPFGHGTPERLSDTNSESPVGQLITMVRRTATLELDGERRNASIQQQATPDHGTAESRVPIPHMLDIALRQGPRSSTREPEATREAKSIQELYAEICSNDMPSREAIESIRVAEHLYQPSLNGDGTREHFWNALRITNIMVPGFIDHIIKEKLEELEEETDEERDSSVEGQENSTSIVRHSSKSDEEDEQDEFED